MLLCFAFFGVARADEVMIGDAESTSSQYTLPVNMFYNYSLTQQIYTADEIGMAGTINSIAFDYINTASFNMNGVKVYMMNVDKENFETTTDMVSLADAQLVWEGTFSATEAGWVTLDLNTPFVYDGQSNLLVCCYDPTSGYPGSSFKFRTTSTSTDFPNMYLAMAYYSDNANYVPNPDDLTTYGGSKTRYQYRANIMLDITPGGGTICDKPETLEVSNVTAYGADVTWTGGSGTYNLQWKKNSGEWSDDNIIPNLTETSYSFTELEGNTTYNVRVQSVCDDRSLSGWKSTSFTTANPCAAPTNLVVSDITPSSATLSWTAGYQETDWTVKYKKSADSWDNATVVPVSGTQNTSLTGLDGLTVYNVRVYNCTGENDPYLSGNFTTAASIPLIEEFPTTTIPTGWARYSGLLSDALNGTAPTTSSSGWYFGNYNGVFDNHTRINIYGTSCKYWLATPEIVMEDNVQLSFEVAYTAYNGTAAAPAQTGTDDKFAVVVFANDELTILRQWDNAGSEYVLNDLGVTPIAVNFDLSSYAGQNVIVAFYAESTESNADNNLHIDNVSIDYIPDCPKPTVLTVADVTAHTAHLSWTSDADAWQICLNDNEDELIGVTTNPYTLENLADATTYTVKVRANCGDEVYSEWSNDVSFTTPIACPAPTGLAASEITGHTAKLNWTGNSEGYNVYYRTKVSVEEGGLFEVFKTTTIPTGWSRYNTLLTDDVLNGTTALTSATSGWNFGNANGVFDIHAKANIYSTSAKYWLVTPSVEVAANYTFDFDLALTKYSGTLQPVDPTQQLDDKFVVLISTDDMATWTILRQWDNAGSEYVYNNIACTANGEHVSFDLSAYVGQTVNIAFYGESTVAGGDNEMHIDNVLVGVPVPAGEWNTVLAETAPYILTGLNPLTEYEVYVESVCTGEQSHVTSTISFTTDVACPAPTGLAAANVGPTSVELSWTSGADAWEVEVTDVETQEVVATVPANTNPFTLTDLIPETAYSVRVRANCGDEGYSEWSGSVTFTTLVACPVPEDLTVSDITYNSATVAWTGFNDSYVVSYRTAAGEDAPFKQNFEKGLGEWTFTSMNAANDIGGTGTNPAGIYPAAAHSGLNGFRFSSYTSKTDDETYDQYLVSPELTETGNLKFYFKKPNNSTETLYFGYSTTTNDLDAFTWTEDLAPTQQWQEYTQELASDVKYIAFHYFGNFTYYVYVDDITIGAYDVPAGEWETVEATESPVILTGLTPETTYEVKMQGFCDGEPTEETAIVTFTTPENPNVPQTIALASGWNWVSFNVEITLDDLEAALLAAYPSAVMNDLSIKSKANGASNWNPLVHRWVGGLQNVGLDLSQMYMVKVPAAGEITVEGMPVDPADYPLTIAPGANWIAFPLSEGMSIADAFAGFPSSGDIVKAKVGGQAQWNSSANRWIGTLANTPLQPGKGYIYNSKATETRTYTYPSPSSAK